MLERQIDSDRCILKCGPRHGSCGSCRCDGSKIVAGHRQEIVNVLEYAELDLRVIRAEWCRVHGIERLVHEGREECLDREMLGAMIQQAVRLLAYAQTRVTQTREDVDEQLVQYRAQLVRRELTVQRVRQEHVIDTRQHGGTDTMVDIVEAVLQREDEFVEE